MDFAPIITGLVTGIGVAYLTFWLHRGVERERWDREDRLRREELDRQAAVRWLDEKRRLFAKLLRLVEDLREISRRRYDGVNPGHWEKPWDEAYNLTAEIGLIEPDMEDVADRVYAEATALASAASKWASENLDDYGRGDAEQPGLEGREEALNDAISAFMKAAAARLRPERLHDRAT